LDWSDNLDVEYVRIMRLRAGESYDTTTNTGGTPIRLPAWGNTFTDEIGTWTYPSNFRGVWHDTEAPLDEAVSWVAVARILSTLARDTFTRSVTDGWGTATSGETYTLVGTAANFDVNGTAGTIQPGTSNSNRIAVIAEAGADRTVAVDFAWSAIPAANSIYGGVIPRYTDSSNFYVVDVHILPASGPFLRIRKNVAGVLSDIATLNLFLTYGYAHNYVAAATWRVKAMISGSTISAKAWNKSLVIEPDWQLTATDTSHATGANVGVFARNDSVTLTIVGTFDNFRATENNRTSVTVSSTPALTLNTNSLVWLKDPLRPALDRSLDLCPTPASGCTGPSGFFFQGLGGLQRDSDHLVAQMANRVRPSQVSRLRKAPTGELRFVSRTLTDRTAAIALVAAGTPLLLQAPAVYGQPDSYLAIGDVSEDRIHVDHRFPMRLWTLPWAEVDAPVGPAQGVPETRWDDLCTLYAAWSNLISAGHTWTDILQGDAA
jgi:hypothetical protein